MQRINRLILIIGLLLLLNIFIVNAQNKIINEFTDCDSSKCYATLGLNRFYNDGNNWGNFDDKVKLEYKNNRLELTWKNNYVYLVPKVTNQNDNLENTTITTAIENKKHSYKFSHYVLKKSTVKKFKYDIQSNLDCNVKGNSLICDNIEIDFSDIVSSGLTLEAINKNYVKVDISNFIDGQNIFIDPVIQLTNPYLIDASVKTSAPTTNFGNADLTIFNSNNATMERAYVTFNISHLHYLNIYNVTNVTFYLGGTVVDGDNMSMYETYQNVSNFTEGSITWNNQPCGTGATFNANCNNTAFAQLLNATKNANILSTFNRNLANNYTYFSFLIFYYHTPYATDQFRSSEDADGEYINITYSLLNTISSPRSVVTRNITASEDTYIDAYNINTNFANSTLLGIEINNPIGDLRDSYFRFNLTNFSNGININNCIVNLKTTSPNNYATFWYWWNNSRAMNEITWADNNVSSLIYFGNITKSTTNDIFTFNNTNLTNLCNQSINGAFAVSAGLTTLDLFNLSTSNTTIYSMEYSQANYRPYLTVMYTSPNGSLIVRVTNTNGFNATLTSTTGFSQNLTGTIGEVYFNPLLYEVYNLTVTSYGYSSSSQLITINSTTPVEVNLTLSLVGALNLTFFDETTNTQLTSNVTLQIISSTYSENYTVTGGNKVLTSLPPDDYELRYWATNYYKNSYFLTVNEYTNNSLRLYLINTTNSNLVTATVQDQYTNLLSGAYIIVYKRFIPENTYRIVRMEKTVTDGEAGLYLNLYDTWYKFNIQYPFGTTLLNTQTDFKVIETNLNFRVNLNANILESYRIIDDVAYSLYYTNTSNSTGYFTFNFIDSNNIVESGCLEVTEIGSFQNTLICNTCESGTSAIITCSVSSTGNVVARAYLDSNTNNSLYLIDTISVNLLDAYSIYGNTGLFLAMLIVLTLVMIGIFHPQVSIILMTLGLIVTYMFGFFIISYTTLVGIIVLTIIFLYAQKEK